MGISEAPSPRVPFTPRGPTAPRFDDTGTPLDFSRNLT